jgi:hypothetical protein
LTDSSSSSKAVVDAGFALFSEAGVTIANAQPAAVEYKKSRRFILADLSGLS